MTNQPETFPDDRYCCWACGAPGLRLFWRMADLPVRCNALCATREEAVAVPRGDIDLAVCERCGFIRNIAFDPDRMAYDQAYENSLHFSPRFQAYAQTLAAQLVNKYDLHGKDILEIACGQGDFLRLLCKMGNNCGIGFDPSYIDLNEEKRDESEEVRVRIVRDYYGKTHGDHSADLLCCRHALEHIPQPASFLRMIRGNLGDHSRTVVFFEVPNVMYTLRDLGVWDVIYEHCSYFSRSSLTTCFVRAGYSVEAVAEEYEGQFLTIEARPGTTGLIPKAIEIEAASVVRDARTFKDRFDEKLSEWRKRFEALRSQGKRAVIWGSGSKGVTFSNMMGEAAEIEYVVDVNPRKQGRYVAGSGQAIVAPEFLHDYQPAAVIVMNPIYVEEIEKKLQSLNVGAEVLVA